MSITRKLSFKITQPCDGVTFEHIIEINQYELQGAENVKPVVDDISLPELFHRIITTTTGGKEGPYQWDWIT